MAEDATKKDEKTVGDIVNSMSEEQKNVLYALVGLALEEGNNDEGDEDVKHNVFDNDTQNDEVLIHDAMNEIMAEGRKCGSLKTAYLEHAADYGIENIEFINTEEKDIYDQLILRMKNYFLPYTDMTEEFYTEKYKDDYWFFAQEAIEHGFCDEILEEFI